MTSCNRVVYSKNNEQLLTKNSHSLSKNDKLLPQNSHGLSENDELLAETSQGQRENYELLAQDKKINHHKVKAKTTSYYRKNRIVWAKMMNYSGKIASS